MSHTGGPVGEPEEETALISALRAGEDAAFEKLVRGYSARLLAVARRILQDEDDARDAGPNDVPEALVQAILAARRQSG